MLLAALGEPLWTEVSVEGSAVVQVAPQVVPDLMARRPAHVSLSLRPEGGTLVVRARSRQGEVVRELQVEPTPEGTGREVISTRFARERVDDLELLAATVADPAAVESQILALGLRHGLATRFISWLAESDQPTVERAATETVVMPHQLPCGMNPRSVGLRGGEFQDILLLDVASSSLGLESAGGEALLMIERNTTVPCARCQTVLLPRDSQGAVQLRVLRDGLLLHELVLELPDQPIEVQLDLTADHELQVTVRCGDYDHRHVIGAVQ